MFLPDLVLSLRGFCLLCSALLQSPDRRWPAGTGQTWPILSPRTPAHLQPCRHANQLCQHGHPEPQPYLPSQLHHSVAALPLETLWGGDGGGAALVFLLQQNFCSVNTSASLQEVIHQHLPVPGSVCNKSPSQMLSVLPFTVNTHYDSHLLHLLLILHLPPKQLQPDDTQNFPVKVPVLSLQFNYQLLLDWKQFESDRFYLARTGPPVLSLLGPVSSLPLSMSDMFCMSVTYKMYQISFVRTNKDNHLTGR